MRISAHIKVMNDGSEHPGCGVGAILAGTDTGGNIDILIPTEAIKHAGKEGVVIELNRDDLIEFISRTMHKFSITFETEAKK